LNELHLRLAGVTRLALDGRGPRDAYVFDPHRLALPCWALALEEAGRAPALLVTFDRHLDLTVPKDPARVPERGAGVLALDAHARLELDVRNIDHVVAAMEAGLVGDVLCFARSPAPGSLGDGVYRDRRGGAHRIEVARTLEDWLDGGGRLPEGDGPALLDVDLDAFTSQNDADPRAVLAWPAEQVRDLLLPEGSKAFWEALLPRTRALTLAREPYHCGGLLGAARLLEVVAPILFGELLGARVP
jgi:hypothetical protein